MTLGIFLTRMMQAFVEIKKQGGAPNSQINRFIDRIIEMQGEVNPSGTRDEAVKAAKTVFMFMEADANGRSPIARSVTDVLEQLLPSLSVSKVERSSKLSQEGFITLEDKELKQKLTAEQQKAMKVVLNVGARVIPELHGMETSIARKVKKADIRLKKSELEKTISVKTKTTISPEIPGAAEKVASAMEALQKQEAELIKEKVKAWKEKAAEVETTNTGEAEKLQDSEKLKAEGQRLAEEILETTESQISELQKEMRLDLEILEAQIQLIQMDLQQVQKSKSKVLFKKAKEESLIKAKTNLESIYKSLQGEITKLSGIKQFLEQQKTKLENIPSDIFKAIDTLKSMLTELQGLQSNRSYTSKVKPSELTQEKAKKRLETATKAFNKAEGMQKAYDKALNHAATAQHRDISYILNQRITTVEQLLKNSNAHEESLQQELSYLNGMLRDTKSLSEMVKKQLGKSLNQFFADLMGGGMNVTEGDLLQKMNQFSAYKKTGGSFKEIVKSHEPSESLSQASTALDLQWKKTAFGTFELTRVFFAEGKVTQLKKALEKENDLTKKLKLEVLLQATKALQLKQQQKTEVSEKSLQEFQKEAFAGRKAPSTRETLRSIYEDQQKSMSDKMEMLKQVEEVFSASLTLKDGKFEARTDSTALKGGLEKLEDRKALAEELNKKIVPEITSVLEKETLSSKDRNVKTLKFSAQAYLYGNKFAKENYENRSKIEKEFQDLLQQAHEMGHEFFEYKIEFNTNRIEKENGELENDLNEIQKMQNDMFNALVEHYLKSIPFLEPSGEMKKLFSEFQAQKKDGSITWKQITTEGEPKIEGKKLSLKEQFARKLALETLQIGREVLLTECQFTRASIDTLALKNYGVILEGNSVTLNGKSIAEKENGNWVRKNAEDEDIELVLNRMSEGNSGDIFSFNKTHGFHRLVAGERENGKVVLKLNAESDENYEILKKDNTNHKWIDKNLSDRMNGVRNMWETTGLFEKSFKVENEIFTFTESMRKLADLEIKFFNKHLIEGFFKKKNQLDGANLEAGERYDGQIARILLLTYKDNIAASFPAGFGKTNSINPTQAVLRYMLRGGGNKNQVIMLPNETFFRDANKHVQEIADYFGINYNSPKNLLDILNNPKMNLNPEGAKCLAALLNKGKGIFMIDMGLGLSIIRNWQNTQYKTNDPMASVYETLAKDLICRADITMDEAHYLAEAAALIQSAEDGTLPLMQTKRGKEIHQIANLLTKSLWQALIGMMTKPNHTVALDEKLANTQGDPLKTIVMNVTDVWGKFDGNFQESFKINSLYEGYSGTLEPGKLVYTYDVEGKKEKEIVEFSLSDLAGIDFEKFTVVGEERGAAKLRTDIDNSFVAFMNNHIDKSESEIEKIKTFNKKRVTLTIGEKNVEMDFGVLLHLQSTFARLNRALANAVMGDKGVRFPEPLFLDMLKRSGIFGEYADTVIQKWNDSKQGKSENWDTALDSFLWNKAKELQKTHENIELKLDPQTQQNLTGNDGVLNHINDVLKSLTDLKHPSLEGILKSLNDQSKMLERGKVGTVTDLLAIRANLNQVEISIQAVMSILAREGPQNVNKEVLKKLENLMKKVAEIKSEQLENVIFGNGETLKTYLGLTEKYTLFKEVLNARKQIFESDLATEGGAAYTEEGLARSFAAGQIQKDRVESIDVRAIELQLYVNDYHSGIWTNSGSIEGHLRGGRERAAKFNGRWIDSSSTLNAIKINRYASSSIVEEFFMFTRQYGGSMNLISATLEPITHIMELGGITTFMKTGQFITGGRNVTKIILKKQEDFEKELGEALVKKMKENDALKKDGLAGLALNQTFLVMEDMGMTLAQIKSLSKTLINDLGNFNLLEFVGSQEGKPSEFTWKFTYQENNVKKEAFMTEEMMQVFFTHQSQFRREGAVLEAYNNGKKEGKEEAAKWEALVEQAEGIRTALQEKGTIGLMRYEKTTGTDPKTIASVNYISQFTNESLHERGVQAIARNRGIFNEKFTFMNGDIITIEAETRDEYVKKMNDAGFNWKEGKFYSNGIERKIKEVSGENSVSQFNPMELWVKDVSAGTGTTEFEVKLGLDNGTINSEDSKFQTKLNILNDHMMENSIRFKRLRFMESTIAAVRKRITYSILDPFAKFVQNDSRQRFDNLVSKFTNKAAANSGLSLEQKTKRMIDPVTSLDQAMDNIFQELKSIFTSKNDATYMQEGYNLYDLLSPEGKKVFEKMVEGFKKDTLTDEDITELQEAVKGRSILQINDIFEMKAKILEYKNKDKEITGDIAKNLEEQIRLLEEEKTLKTLKTLKSLQFIEEQIRLLGKLVEITPVGEEGKVRRYNLLKEQKKLVDEMGEQVKVLKDRGKWVEKQAIINSSIEEGLKEFKEFEKSLPMDFIHKTQSKLQNPSRSLYELQTELSRLELQRKFPTAKQYGQYRSEADAQRQGRVEKRMQEAGEGIKAMAAGNVAGAKKSFVERLTSGLNHSVKQMEDNQKRIENLKSEIDSLKIQMNAQETQNTKQTIRANNQIITELNGHNADLKKQIQILENQILLVNAVLVPEKMKKSVDGRLEIKNVPLDSPEGHRQVILAILDAVGVNRNINLTEIVSVLSWVLPQFLAVSDANIQNIYMGCLLYTSPSPRD